MISKIVMIRADSNQLFVDRINELIEKGYQPQGNVFMKGSQMCLLMAEQDDGREAFAELIRNIINDVTEMQENGCTDSCHDISHNLEQMYKEVLNGE